MNNGYKQFFKAAQDIKSEERLRQALMPKKKRKTPPPFPWRSAVGMSVTLAVLGFYLAAPDKVESFIDRIEIHAFGAARAQNEPAEKSRPKPSKAEKPAVEKTDQAKKPGGDETVPVAEELSHFNKLRQRKEELDLREKELAQLEEELQRQKVELDKRIVQLERMRNEISQILKDRVEVDQEKVNKLVDLYSNMKPKQAAEILGSINEDLAVEVLAKMKKKSAAEIMNLLPPEKAKVLSEKYTGYRRTLADKG